MLPPCACAPKMNLTYVQYITQKPSTTRKTYVQKRQANRVAQTAEKTKGDIQHYNFFSPTTFSARSDGTLSQYARRGKDTTRRAPSQGKSMHDMTLSYICGESQKKPSTTPSLFLGHRMQETQRVRYVTDRRVLYFQESSPARERSGTE